MEGFGHDVALKIKSAIKAKLVELDAYVDDELPDYIIVMVANKKPKAQMTEDLSLFLGDNTAKFTDWLHEVLDKLHAVTLDNSFKSETKSTEKQVVVNNSSEVVSTSEKVTANDVKSLGSQNTENSNTFPTKVENDLILSLDQNDGVETEPQDEMLTIKAEDDLLGEEFQDDVPALPPVSKPKHRQIKIVKPIVASHLTNSVTSSTKVNDSLSSVQNPVKLDAVNSYEVQRDTLNNKTNLSDHITCGTLPLNRKRKAPSSAVGAILQRDYPQEEDEEDEYGSKRQLTGAMASVVQVAQRRPSVPPDRQANKILLLKAVDEAQKSILKHTQKSSIGKVDANVPPSQLFTKTYIERQKQKQQMLKLSKTASISSNQHETSLQEIELDLTPSTEYQKDVGDITEEIVEEEKLELSSDVLMTDDSDRVVIVQNKPVEAQVNPKFIITLDGVDPSKFESQLDDTQWRDADDYLMLDDDVDMNLTEKNPEDELQYSTFMDAEESEDCGNGVDGVARSADISRSQNERCRYWPACKNGANCFYRHPSTPCKTFPKCKFGNQCLYIHPNCKFDAACTRRDCPFTHASARNYQTNSSNQVVKTVPHPARRSTAMTALTATSQKICRDFPTCNNVDCQFYHPKPCRYGQGCTRNDCVFFHPPLPTPDKLKWTKIPTNQTLNSKSLTSSGHISERLFANNEVKQKLPVVVATLKS